MFGFKEYAVFDNFGVGVVVIETVFARFEVNVCHVVVKFFAVNGEGVGIEYVDFAFHEFFADFDDFSTVPAAAAPPPTFVRTTEPVLMEPVQSLSTFAFVASPPAFAICAMMYL
mgnify:CR=1 FL=1